MLQLAAAATLNLICQGTAAVDHTTTTVTPYGVVSTDGRVSLDDSVGFRIADDGTGTARLPRRMLPTVTTSNDGGWFPLIKLAQTADEITAQVRLNQFNKPRIRIDRVTGAVRIDGPLGEFSGQCRPYDPATPRKF
jgi:hypothetical protein